MSRWTPKALSEIGMRTGWELAEFLYEPVSLRQAVWLITRETALFNSLKGPGKLDSPWLEYPFHLALLPYALAKRIIADRSFSGESMLARFVKRGQ
jgi:hypothetical protein